MMRWLRRTFPGPQIWQRFNHSNGSKARVAQKSSVVPKNGGVDANDAEKGRDETVKAKLQTIVRQFPTVSTTVGYGSGVFAQNGYKKTATPPQIDMIHVVPDTRQFHQLNLAQNRSHYSGLKLGGVWLIEWVQKLGVGLYYNPFVKIDGSMVKYGIVSKATAIKDLVEWQNLYIAGRLQKPVKFLGQEAAVVRELNGSNLKNALVLSVLIINNSPDLSKQKLFETVTSLSYLGDIRMAIGGENPNKIKNIVSKQYHNFVKLYDPIIEQLVQENVLKRNNDTLEVDLTNEQKHALISQLPLNFKARFFDIYGNDIQVMNDNLPKKLVSTLQKIVLYPSIIQSLKGIFTAGIYKTVVYVIEKRMKFLQK